MKTFSLLFPRLNIALTAPDSLVPDIQAAFFHSIRSEANLPFRNRYVIEATTNGLALQKDRQPIGEFSSCLELVCRLEEDIENLLIKAIGNWVGFHAGAVMIEDTACIIPGNPDTGKTTTTFNLVEMVKIFLCEEVTPVDPETLMIYPYPQALGLDAAYTEKYRSLYPVTKGKLNLLDFQTARYRPYTAGSDPVPLKTILIPAYDPSGTPKIESLSPGEVFTELLGYCFPPNTDDEHLFDSVIKICETAEIFRLHSNSLRSMRELLKELFGPNLETSKP